MAAKRMSVMGVITNCGRIIAPLMLVGYPSGDAALFEQAGIRDGYHRKTLLVNGTPDEIILRRVMVPYLILAVLIGFGLYIRRSPLLTAAGGAEKR